jgi:hypothetical protein
MLGNWLRLIGIRIRGTPKSEGDPPNLLPSESAADVASPGALEPALTAASTARALEWSRRPPEGHWWLYISAEDCDVASIVRSIEGVTKVSRERGGYWLVTSSREIAGEAAKSIVSKGGILTTITTFDTLIVLHGLVAPREA